MAKAHAEDMLPSPAMHKVLRPRRGLARLNLGELWAYRELLVFLAWRDILVRYKQTVIGIFWAFIRPLVTMVVFTIIFGRIAKLPSNAVPYPLFAFAGLLPWQLFSTAFMEASNSVVGNSQLVSKVYFPRLIIPISATFSALADFLVSILILVGLLLWYRVPVSANVLWLIPLTVLCMLIAAGAGIWFSALFVRYRDIRHLIPFVMQLGTYISPVGFSSAVVPERWRLLYSLNPMVGVIDGFRWALFGGLNSVSAPALAMSVATALVLLAGGTVYFRNTERVFADII
jgi:lipopolysaccharide transport system permease protein